MEWVILVVLFLPGIVSALLIYGGVLWAVGTLIKRRRFNGQRARIVFVVTALGVWIPCALVGWFLCLDFLMKVAGHVALAAFVWPYILVSAIIFTRTLRAKKWEQASSRLLKNAT